jgi:hypothetical protein
VPVRERVSVHGIFAAGLKRQVARDRPTVKVVEGEQNVNGSAVADDRAAPDREPSYRFVYRQQRGPASFVLHACTQCSSIRAP